MGRIEYVSLSVAPEKLAQQPSGSRQNSRKAQIKADRKQQKEIVTCEEKRCDNPEMSLDLKF